MGKPGHWGRGVIADFTSSLSTLCFVITSHIVFLNASVSHSQAQTPAATALQVRRPRLMFSAARTPPRYGDGPFHLLEQGAGA